MAYPRRIFYDFAFPFVLTPLLCVRLVQDGPAIALERLLMVAIALVSAFVISSLSARELRFPPSEGQWRFALLLAVLVPTPAGWGVALMMAVFGWVFTSVAFGSRPVVAPSLAAAAFGLMAFPNAGLELQAALSATPNMALMLSAIPGVAWLVSRGILSWRAILAAVLATGAISLVMTGPSALSLNHLMIGAFAPVIFFIAADARYAPRTSGAQWVYGALVGTLVMTFRTANPEQPDGVIAATLLAMLFAPLLDRFFRWGQANA